MWDSYQLPRRGNFSLRKIVLLLLTVTTSAFLWATLYSTPAYAADAQWQESNIKYGPDTYQPHQASTTGIPANSQIYSIRDDQGDKAKVVYIPSNTDTAKEIRAFFVECTYTDAAGYACPGPPHKALTLDAKPKKEKTGCDVPGVGWIMCPVSRAIASGMDNVFDWIAGFLEVKPISTDTSSGLYKAWEIARGLANLAFIVAFLVIIYSQITSMGINNYNIKKMIPRLIVAAILVNVSFYICAVAVDISNILGYSVQQALVDIRKSLPDPGMGDWLNWKNITEYILSGGTIAAAGIAGWAAIFGGAGGSISALAFLLLPILIAGALAVLVALIILAARQALITVLIVIAPLAFVAYLLPNTEKWFEKWKDIFMTMLLLFPLFSLLFGGSQLASAIIIQNANQFSVVLFALFIQVAPLVVTPFLVKFSGSLLGRLAGMVNNPQKGIIDSTRNWARERADLRKGAGISRGANQRFGMRRIAYKRDMNRRNREGLKNMYEGEADAAWHNDKRYHAIHRRNKTSEVIKAVGETNGDVEFEKYKARTPVLQQYVGRQRQNQDEIKLLQSKEEAAWEEAKSLDFNKNGTNPFEQYASKAHEMAEQAQATAYRAATAQAMQKIEYANAVVKNASLAKQAGGIDIEGGADSARAAALTAIKKSKTESIAEGRALYEHFNLSSGDRQKLAKGIAVEGKADDGTTRVFTPDVKYVRMAAIEQQVTYGTVEERQELILKTGKGKELHDYRDIISEAMVKGNIGQVANYLGGKTIDDVRSGRLMGKADLLRAAATSIAKGKLSPEQLLNQDKTSMETIVEAVRQTSRGQIHLDGEYASAIGEELERLFYSAERAMTDPRINVRLGERANAIKELRDIGREGTPFTPPTEPIDTPPDIPPSGTPHAP